MDEQENDKKEKTLKILEDEPEVESEQEDDKKEKTLKILEDEPEVESEKEDDKKKETHPKVRKSVQDKILAFMGQELQTDREEMTKQECAEGIGYLKEGTHRFFYSFRDLEQEKEFVVKTGGKLYALTELGKANIPHGTVIVSARKDNAGKQEFFLKALLKQCKEAKPEKAASIFDILSDGQDHALDEFVAATGYANLKSKGLGYTFGHMEKKMKILEKTEGKMYRFTDKCFPEGRP
jgi:hypothetical protein